MDILQAALDVSLCRAVSVTTEARSRVPLPIRAGRIGSSLAARAYRVDLRDHLIFPGLINAHDHLHVNAVPPLKAARHPVPNSYAWIAAFQAHFENPAVIAALQVPKELRLRHGALKNLLAGTTCVAHHDPWHPALDALNFPVALLRDYGWSYALGWPGYGPPVQQSFAATPTDRPWLIHLAEGTDATAQAELCSSSTNWDVWRRNSRADFHGVGPARAGRRSGDRQRRSGGLVSDQQPHPAWAVA